MKPTCKKKYETWNNWMDKIGIVQEIEICPHCQMLYAQTKISPRE